MQPEMTPHEIANEIGVRQIQSRIYGEGETFVMVEGRTDLVLWEEFRAKDDCTLYPTQGKDKIIAALQVTRKRDMRGVAGIVDADYWLITDADELGAENLLYDDCCPDMELILLCSPALKKVLRNELTNYEIDAMHELADKLTSEALRLAMEYGYFRWLNECCDYGLACNDIRLAKAIDADALTFDRDWVALRLAEGRNSVTSEQLLEETAELREKCPPETILLCRGKDVLAIMALILPRLFESRFGHELPANAAALRDASQLAKELRKTYEYMYFRDTSLFGCIRAWERANREYKILKPEL